MRSVPVEMLHYFIHAPQRFSSIHPPKFSFLKYPHLADKRCRALSVCGPPSTVPVVFRAPHPRGSVDTQGGEVWDTLMFVSVSGS